MKLGEWMKEYRNQHNMSMQEMADICGFSKAYVSMLEKGINPTTNKPVSPTMQTFEKIATATGQDVDSLLKIIEGGQPITIRPYPTKFSDDEKNLIYNYRELNDGGKKVIMDMIGQLNFGNRAVRKVARSSTVALSSEVERPAAVARPLRLSRSAPRIHFNNIRPEVKVPSAVVNSASAKKITGVEVEAVGVLAKTVGVGKRMAVDKPVISARSFKDD